MKWTGFVIMITKQCDDGQLLMYLSHVKERYHMPIDVPSYEGTAILEKTVFSEL